MIPTLPPSGNAAKLWRSLLALPRPSVDLEYRLPSAPTIPLRVFAVSAHEFAAAGSVDGGAAVGLVLAALCLADGTPAFRSAKQVGLLPEREAVELALVVSEALCVCSPTAITADVHAWERVLEEGASAPENRYDLLALGNCCDVSWGMGQKAVHVTHHPEWWFGVPQRELIDCHWMAYFAAIKARRSLLNSGS